MKTIWLQSGLEAFANENPDHIEALIKTGEIRMDAETKQPYLVIEN